MAFSWRPSGSKLVVFSGWRTPHRRRLSYAPPRLEALEDRMVPSLAPAVFYPAGPGPAYGIVHADLTGSGKQDLIVTNRTSDQITVLLGNGDGTFGTPTSFSTGAGSQPELLAVGDVNGDGIPDIITPNASTNDISVLLGKGDGTFLPAVRYGVHFHPDSIALGDFNGDGNVDLVVTNHDSNDISVLLGRGDGTFLPAVNYAVGSGPNSVLAGDFNGDGKLDLAVSNFNQGTVSILLGNGDGTFLPPVNYGVGSGPSSLVAADFNNDGRIDLAVANYGNSIVSVLLGNGDGTFQNTRNTTVGTDHPGGLGAADFDGDGRLDVVVGDVFDSRISVALGNGDGTFQSSTLYNAGPGSSFLIVSDFNGDGLPDVAVADTGSATVAVFLSLPAPHDTFAVAGLSQVTAGQSFTFTVTAKRAAGGTDAGYLGTVQFTSSDAAAGLPADYTFTPADQGTHTFTAELRTAGTASITATDTATAEITGSLEGIVVNAGQASTFVVAGFPSLTVAGQVNTFTVSAADGFGNAVMDYTGTVHFTSSDSRAILPVNYTFTPEDHGTHTFGAVLRTAGTASLTGTDTVTASITGSQQGIMVNADQASTFIVTGYPSPTVAGQVNTFTVSAADAYGNTVTTYTGTIHFTSSDAAAGLPANYTFTRSDQGVHTFSAVLRTAGTVSLTATDTVTASIAGSQQGIVVNPSAVYALRITGLPSVIHVGQIITFTVQAVDAYGNVVTGYQDTVHFSSSDQKASLPANYTFTTADRGSHSFGAVFRTKGSQTIQVRDTLHPELTTTVAVNVVA